MANSLFSILLFSILFFLQISHIYCFIQPGFKHRLIHRFSLSRTKFDLLHEASIDATTPLLMFTSLKAIYFINVTIGNPPIQQYLHVDTGSSLTWVRARQNDPNSYDPDASKTFKYINCGDPICMSDHLFYCNALKNNFCGYSIGYFDGSTSFGVIGHEQFGLVNFSDPGNHVIIDKVLFGALGEVRGDPRMRDAPEYNGIFGIGPGNTSLINQLSEPKLFSYCVASVMQPNEESQSYIYFGEDESLNDIPTTPLIKDPYHYIVEIESISLDNTYLAFDPSIFKRVPNTPRNGVTMDTGSSASILADAAYDIFEEAIMEMMAARNQSLSPNRGEALCYEGSLNDLDVSSYPSLNINFVGGATMVNTVAQYFFATLPREYCLSFYKSSLYDEEDKFTNILGLLSQQYSVFNFDLDNWSMGIMSDTMCEYP